jgi:hypothetical protein
MNIEVKNTRPAKPLKEPAPEREPVKHWSSAPTNWKTACVAGSLIVLILMWGIHELLKPAASLGGSTLVVHSEPPDSPPLSMESFAVELRRTG